jgi:hypothetical protein
MESLISEPGLKNASGEESKGGGVGLCVDTALSLRLQLTRRREVAGGAITTSSCTGSNSTRVDNLSPMYNYKFLSTYYYMENQHLIFSRSL